MRKYSIDEIDRMRSALNFKCWGSNGSVIEDQLRTYMLAGVEPDDLQKVAQAIQDGWQKNNTMLGVRR